MKHHELLDKIYWHWRRDLRGADGLQPMTDYRRALLAVVEVHRPIKDNEHLCGGCWFGDGMMPYPCPTIQAIEKELG